MALRPARQGQLGRVEVAGRSSNSRFDHGGVFDRKVPGELSSGVQGLGEMKLRRTTRWFSAIGGGLSMEAPGPHRGGRVPDRQGGQYRGQLVLVGSIKAGMLSGDVCYHGADLGRRKYPLLPSGGRSRELRKPLGRHSLAVRLFPRAPPMCSQPRRERQRPSSAQPSSASNARKVSEIFASRRSRSASSSSMSPATGTTCKQVIAAASSLTLPTPPTSSSYTCSMADRRQISGELIGELLGELLRRGVRDRRRALTTQWTSGTGSLSAWETLSRAT
jgi:hypothetical protein